MVCKLYPNNTALKNKKKFIQEQIDRRVLQQGRKDLLNNLKNKSGNFKGRVIQLYCFNNQWKGQGCN